MASKNRLLTLRQVAFDVVQTVINELLAADHDRFRQCFDGPAKSRLRELLPDAAPSTRTSSSKKVWAVIYVG